METKRTPLKTPKKAKLAQFNRLDKEQLLNKKRELEIEAEQLDQEIAKWSKSGVSSDLKPEMKALHDYNDMKDLTQCILGYLADAEHTTLSELHERFNLPSD